MNKCPFCGKNVAIACSIVEAEDVTAEDVGAEEYDWKKNHFTVVCDFLAGGCGASTGGHYETLEAAIDAWENRA